MTQQQPHHDGEADEPGPGGEEDGVAIHDPRPHEYHAGSDQGRRQASANLTESSLARHPTAATTRASAPMTTTAGEARLPRNLAPLPNYE